MANMTELHLLNVPFENDYKNTKYFATPAGQQSYFKSRVAKSYTDFNYQRKDNKIRVPELFDDVINYNYVMYKNEHSDKWWYAFIVNTEFVSMSSDGTEGRTDIYIETDVIQSYLFDYTVRPSFVEREHVANDDIGLHTIDEGLETGDFACIAHSYDVNLSVGMIVWGTTKDADGENIAGDRYNGIYSGLKYYWCTSANYESGINNFLTGLAKGAHADAMNCVFLAPRFLVDGLDETNGTNEVPNSSGAKGYSYNQVGKVTELKDGYKPRNNKLLCYPYNFLRVSNNAGASTIYHYEKFTNATNCTFEVQGCLTPGCSIRMIPKNYNGCEMNDDEGINLGKYPICNWNTDVYTNWLTQNSMNIGVNMAMGVANMGVGMLSAVVGASSGASIASTYKTATDASQTGRAMLGANIGGNMGAGVLGGADRILTTLAQQKAMSFTPPQVSGNINCGDVVTATFQNTFHYYRMSVKKEYAQIIDEYFDMYGYKVNRVKIPNSNHRRNWWYIKTIDVNIDGAIPQNDLQTIRACYDRGITFWRSDDVGNYGDMNNAIISNGNE